MKSAWIGSGFSHQSVPSLSKTATRSSGGSPSADTRSTKSSTASLAAPSFQDASGSPMLSAGRERRLELLDHLVDREARRLLPRRELLERLEELRRDRVAASDDVGVVEDPVVVRVRGHVGALERVGAQVEELRDAQRHERLGPDPQRPLRRCSMKTTFQLSNRSASTSPSSEK